MGLVQEAQVGRVGLAVQDHPVGRVGREAPEGLADLPPCRSSGRILPRPSRRCSRCRMSPSQHVLLFCSFSIPLEIPLSY